MRFSTYAVASFLATLVSADYAIDPSSVSLAMRQVWCTSQEASCPLICLQKAGNSADTKSNQCDPKYLTYACVCSNGLSPNISEYSQTLPYFICSEWGNQCVSNCGSNSACASDCRQNNPCGAQNPTRVNITSSALSASATTAKIPAGATTDAAGDVIFTGGLNGAVSTNAAEPGSAAASGTYHGGAQGSAVFHLGQTFTLVSVVALFFGGFAVLL